MLVVTCTQNKSTKAMRALLAENVPEPPGNVWVGPGTGWRSLRKICAARDAVSQGVLRACMGSEAARSSAIIAIISKMSWVDAQAIGTMSERPTGLR